MKLLDADAIVRSKNAGPFRFTLDVIFNDRKQFERMKASGVWNREYLCQLCHVADVQVDECVFYERPLSSGAFGDNDIYGSQQHVSLYGLEF